MCLPFNRKMDGPSAGSNGLIMRKEPFQGAVSTVEAVARVLEQIEGNTIASTSLLRVLRTMVVQQHHVDISTFQYGV